jgi:hypothetical protein
VQSSIEIPIKKDMGIEMLKELAGINIKEINPQIYNLFLENKIQKNIKRISNPEVTMDGKQGSLDELKYLNTFIKSTPLDYYINQIEDQIKKAREDGY